MLESVKIFELTVACRCRGSVMASLIHGLLCVLNMYITASVTLMISSHDHETFPPVPKCLTLLLTFLGLN